MVAKMARALVWLIREALLMIGGVVVFVVVWFMWPSGEKKAEKQAEPVAIERAAESCACGGVNWCSGPRGGSYCLTDAGNKRYRQ